MAQEKRESGGDGLAPGTLAVLAATPAVLDALLGQQPQDVLVMRGEEGWSPKDVLAHLISIQGPALVDRVRAMVDSDLPLLPNVDEHETLESSGLRDRPAHELLNEFAEQRGRAMLFLERLGRQETRRRGRHELAGEVTVADAIHHMAYHDLLHIGQISALLAGPIQQSRGGMGEAFPV